MGSDKPRNSCGKMASNRQIFIVGYQQFVDRRHENAALCSARGPSTVARKLCWRFSMSGVATPLNGSVYPSGSPHVDGSDV